MSATPIRVSVLGTPEDALYCSSDLFIRAAINHGGSPVFEPPPFACPCSDGLLIIYTFKRTIDDDIVDIHGGYILVTTKELELETRGIKGFWERSEKFSDAATMLRNMGFTCPSPTLLN